MPVLSLHQLRCFLAAYEQRSFTAAAAELQLAQPSLSEQVRLLERSVGAPLFARAGRGVVPTEAAEALRPHAQRTLAAQDLRCEGTTVEVDTAGFQAPLGQPGDVTVSITCVVGMADLLAPGLPGSVTVEASFISPVDAYRER